MSALEEFKAARRALCEQFNDENYGKAWMALRKAEGWRGARRDEYREHRASNFSLLDDKKCPLIRATIAVNPGIAFRDLREIVQIDANRLPRILAAMIAQGEITRDTTKAKTASGNGTVRTRYYPVEAAE